MAYRSRSPFGRGRPRNRQSVDDHYFQPNPRPEAAYHQSDLALEYDRQYAERLAYSLRDDEAQIARDYQLAIQLSRERSASPRRDLDLELALQMSRERSVTPPRQWFGNPQYEVPRMPTGEEEARQPAPEEYQQRAPSPGLFIGEDEIQEQPEAPEIVEEVQRTPNCVICGDATTNRDSVAISCGHRMCNDDVLTIFNHAMTDETLFPPRCCRAHEIDVDAARAALGRRFPGGFDQRALEMRTVDRTYCHVPECSTFIAAEHITNDVALCPTCEEWTCTLCKQAGHRRGECPEDPAQQQLEEMAEQNGWRRCNECRAMVELNYGCNHMTCRCGHQFCYVCGTPWRNCNCNPYNQRRLQRRAAEIAIRPRARPLQVPDAIPDEDLDVEEQHRRLRDFQRQAPAHVIQPAFDRIFGGRAQAPPRRQRRHRDHAAVQHGDRLIADLNRTQAAHRRAREDAEQARTRRFAAALPLRLADADDIAAHLRENHECAHGARWRRFHAGINRCEICQRVKANPAVAFNFNNFNNPGRRLGGDNAARRTNGWQRHREGHASPSHRTHHATAASRQQHNGHGRHGGRDEHEARQIQRDRELAMRLELESSDDEPGPWTAQAGRHRQNGTDRAEAGPSRAVRERERTPYARGPKAEAGPSNAPQGRPRQSEAHIVEAGPSNTRDKQPERNTAPDVSHAHASTTSNAATTPAAKVNDSTKCVVCGDVPATGDSITTACNHRMCRECLEGAVRAGLGDRQDYPPRCCPIDKKGEITLASARKFLPDDVIRDFESKAEEWGAKNGTYCYAPRCSAFIPHNNVREDKNVGTCPKCRAQTCTLCKLESHPGKKCPKDPGKQALKTLADDKGWKACPSCGVTVELVFGCNQMKCRCGNTFCYKCGGPYGLCRCKLWDESNRHLERPPGEYWEHQWEQVNWDDDYDHPGDAAMDTERFFQEFLLQDLHREQERQRAHHPLASYRAFGDAGFDDFVPRTPRGFDFPEPPRRRARRSGWDGYDDDFMTPPPFRRGRGPSREPPPRRGYWDYY